MDDAEDPKAALRREILARRDERDDDARTEAAHAIAAHLLATAVARADVVAAYLSMDSEPSTEPLIAGLLARGARVIVPLARPGGRLDWVHYDPSARTVTSPLGMEEPDAAPLGADAVHDAGLVVVPALAVDHQGMRLGRGGGYYDRALVDVTAPVCALLFADELLESVPAQSHDRPVDLVATEGGIFRVGI